MFCGYMATISDFRTTKLCKRDHLIIPCIELLETNLYIFFYRLFITSLTPPHVCDMIWISNVILHSLSYFQLFDVLDWYLWNCWPSLFKLSVHNLKISHSKWVIGSASPVEFQIVTKITNSQGPIKEHCHKFALTLYMYT